MTGAPATGGHVGGGAVGEQAVAERAGSGLHNLAEAGVEHQSAHADVVHPQVESLGEDLVVVGIAGLIVAVGELVGVEEVVDDDEILFAVVVDLFGTEFGVQRIFGEA